MWAPKKMLPRANLSRCPLITQNIGLASSQVQVSRMHKHIHIFEPSDVARYVSRIKNRKLMADATDYAHKHGICWSLYVVMAQNWWRYLEIQWPTSIKSVIVLKLLGVGDATIHRCCKCNKYIKYSSLTAGNFGNLFSVDHCNTYKY